MSRLPYAATVLISQVRDERPDVLVTNASLPDGFDVVRVVAFDRETSRWLAPLLHVIKDPRIAGLDTWNHVLHVTFIAGPKADQRHPFPLLDASTVLGG